MISPLLANLFLHYAFDLWMDREYPHLPFERFADDGIVHCRSEGEAKHVMASLAGRLSDCKLEGLGKIKTKSELYGHLVCTLSQSRCHATPPALTNSPKISPAP